MSPSLYFIISSPIHSPTHFSAWNSARFGGLLDINCRYLLFFMFKNYYYIHSILI